MRRPIGGAIAPANAALMVEQTVVSVGPRRRFVPTTELANQIADALEDGLALPAPAPTNNPDRLARLCRDLRDLRRTARRHQNFPPTGSFECSTNRRRTSSTGSTVSRRGRGRRPTRRRPTRRLTRRRATRFAGQMSFTNNGAAGHNAVIRDVSATIELGDRKIEQYSQSCRDRCAQSEGRVGLRRN